MSEKDELTAFTDIFVASARKNGFIVEDINSAKAVDSKRRIRTRLSGKSKKSKVAA